MNHGDGITADLAITHARETDLGRVREARRVCWFAYSAVTVADRAHGAHRADDHFCFLKVLPTWWLTPFFAVLGCPPIAMFLRCETPATLVRPTGLLLGLPDRNVDIFYPCCRSSSACRCSCTRSSCTPCTTSTVSPLLYRADDDAHQQDRHRANDERGPVVQQPACERHGANWPAMHARLHFFLPPGFFACVALSFASFSFAFSVISVFFASCLSFSLP